MRWLPIAGTIFLGVLLSAGAALAARRAEDAAIRRAVAEEADQIADRVAFDTQSRTNVLLRMAERWEEEGGFTRKAWEIEASQHTVRLAASFLAIGRADPDGVVQWLIPSGRDGRGEDLDLSSSPVRVEAMERARSTGALAVVAPVPLPRAGEGILLFVPLRARTRFDGWLVGVVGMDTFLWEAQRNAPGYRVSIADRGRLVYASEALAIPDFCVARPLSELHVTLVLEVCATPHLIEATRGTAPMIALLGGLGITALSGGLAASLAMARSRAVALERTNRDLADLSYAVSHEMRTPLRAIDGYASILAEQVPDTGQAPLSRIRANAQRMGQQIDGLIELMRVVRYAPQPRRVDVSALAREELEALASADPDRRVIVKVAHGIHVYAGPELVGVILCAILDNAWKFTNDRAPAIIEVGPYPGGFYVRDNGAGFDMKYADRLFSTFETLHSPGQYEGLGIGLAIAARAAESLGGSVTASSRPGEGATFRVVLSRERRWRSFRWVRLHRHRAPPSAAR